LAREKPPAERTAFLEVLCAGDEALRRRLEAVLDAFDHPGSFLAQPLLDPGTSAGHQQGDHAGADSSRADPDSALTPGPMPEEPGSRIGPYKLLQLLGEGGFGVVYMAEQTQPVQRNVALKIIKPGMDSRQVIARFEAERQALALMDH